MSFCLQLMRLHKLHPLVVTYERDFSNVQIYHSVQWYRYEWYLHVAMCVSSGAEQASGSFCLTHVTLHFFRPVRFREKELRDEEGNKKTGSDAGSGELSAAPVKAGDQQAEV